MKCAVLWLSPEERRAQDSTINLVGVTERPTVAFHLFIGAPTVAAKIKFP